MKISGGAKCSINWSLIIILVFLFILFGSSASRKNKVENPGLEYFIHSNNKEITKKEDELDE